MGSLGPYNGPNDWRCAHWDSSGKGLTEACSPRPLKILEVFGGLLPLSLKLLSDGCCGFNTQRFGVWQAHLDDNL